MWERPVPNVLGRDIRLIGDTGVDHPAPQVLPRTPLHLVVADCTGLKLFQTDNAFIDSEHEVYIISWWDPGSRDNRYLTILGDTHSCRALWERHRS